MVRRIGKVERIARRAFLHVVLAMGSFVFAIPFIWLFSTSCKVPDEMYPPKWVPQIPEGVASSPYIRIRENEKPVRPVRVREEDWERLAGPVEAAITERLVSMQGRLPGLYGQYLREPDLAKGVFNRVLKRAPDHLFEKNELVVTSWFGGEVTDEIVYEVFDMVYRRASLSDVVLHGWDMSVEYPTEGGYIPWTVAKGSNVQLVDRKTGLRRASKELHYSFENQDSFTVQAIVPMNMAPENLKKVVVSNHADRSWHEVNCTLEMAGVRYESVQKGFLGSDQWQEWAWQFPSEMDHSVETKNWLRIREAGPSEFREQGRLRVTLDFNRALRPKAVANKYMFNYREVLRMIPVTMYLRNSLVLVVLNVLGQIVGSSLVAFSFARLRWPARDFCFFLVLATLMIPPQVTMIPVFLIFKNLGWYNTLKPLWVVSFFGSAFYIFLLRQFMRSIPGDLEDSAKIDGCGYLGIYWRIIMPLIKPALATIGIFTSLAVWNDFMGPLIYVNDQALYPLSLGLFALKVFKTGDYGLMMAGAVMMTLPIIILFFVAQREFIQGITLTGMKG
ncbi:MAG TPA: ABC transporter permease subunit [Candidatus Hydrogenedentes bacterium]|nr:ABC transporter permease subunit [Candidatus Hydrogenedentota bacterium]HQH54765.1 ABC transporter permease subunit [Candidatus Hydrogenedentota bacterium]